jgi:hypothetical protein
MSKFNSLFITDINVNTFQDRLKLFKETEFYFRKMNKYNCLKSLRKTGNVFEYILENGSIILKKRIGSNSRYGVIFFTINNINKQLFATKLTIMEKNNYKEIVLANHLSKISVRNLSPHFLFVYKYFYCMKNKPDKTLPSLIRNDNYYISVNELINGNFKQFIQFNYSSEMLLNAFQQILISILSFHYFTNGMYHTDCHYKNFLFIKIKPGGYFHYKIYGNSYYIKNLGYLWLIWDFGLVKDDFFYKLDRIKDFIIISEILFQKIDDIPKYENIKKITKNIMSHQDLVGRKDKEFFDECISNILLKKKDIEKSFQTINKKPYIINDF